MLSNRVAVVRLKADPRQIAQFILALSRNPLDQPNTREDLKMPQDAVLVIERREAVNLLAPVVSDMCI